MQFISIFYEKLFTFYTHFVETKSVDMSQTVLPNNQSHESPAMERNIHEMLKDSPVLNDSNNAVHSGTAPPTPKHAGFMPHPTSLPLTQTTGK